MWRFDQNFSVRPTSEADVSVIVRAARDADLPISIRRLGFVLVETFHLTIHNMGTLWIIEKWNIKCCAFSGGHSYTCTNIKQDSVHIDMRGMDSIQLTQVGACLWGQDITPTANSTIILILRENTILTFSQCSPIATTILGQQQSHRSGSHSGARSYMGQCTKIQKCWCWFHQSNQNVI